MLPLWNLSLLLLLLLLLSLHSVALTGENVKKRQQFDTDTAVQHLPQPSQRPRGSGVAPLNPTFGPESVHFLGLPLSWPLASSEESDRQGVIGEYSDSQESTETRLLYSNVKGLTTSTPTESTTKHTTSKGTTQPLMSSSAGIPPQDALQQKLKYQPSETSTGENQPTSQDEKSDQDSTSSLSAGPSPERTTPPAITSRWEWTTGQGAKQQETSLVNKTGDQHHVTMEVENGDFKNNDLHFSQTSSTLLLDDNMDKSTTPCKTANQSWTSTYPNDFTPSESLQPSLASIHCFFVPLYSDWNSALATWGFAWEAHIYGLGSVFTVFGLMSVVCLLGLPLRCPPGSPYFILLHLFLLAFSATQAFCLLYDAYNHQDRLPSLESLLLSMLPYPCLISSFSLAFHLLSLRLRKRLSLPLATSFSALPKPCLLLFITLLHFAVSLGCVGILQLFQSFSSMILLFPQAVFVCLTIFLSCSYLIFYCLIKIDTKHIYRLNDSGENGESPEVKKPASCPFANVGDWNRAAGAGVGAALCLLGCGGLQLYGILHAFGLGGLNSQGFQPWPWWGYQVGCRLCEVGVCLGLSFIGTHPLFCHNNSSIKSHPRPGSWSRLSCSSPSRGFTLPSQEYANSPVLSIHNSWSPGQQEKLVVCDVITKGHPEDLPLCSMLDSPQNKLVCVPKSGLNILLPLPTLSSPLQKPKNAVELQQSSLDSLGLETDSTVDLRPPSPINLSRSIDQALYNESLFSHSIFGLPRLFHPSSSLSLNSLNQDTSKQGLCCVENSLYRTSSCGDVNQENMVSSSRPSPPHCSLVSHSKSPNQWDWKGSDSGSTQGLFSIPKDSGKLQSHSWANRGHHFAQSSLPRAIPHLSYHRRYRTLSLASQDSQASGRLAVTKQLSESKQLEWDLAVQAEFVNVCKQIDALSVCSDTIDL